MDVGCDEASWRKRSIRRLKLQRCCLAAAELSLSTVLRLRAATTTSYLLLRYVVMAAC